MLNHDDEKATKEREGFVAEKCRGTSILRHYRLYLHLIQTKKRPLTQENFVVELLNSKKR
jgi:hypothetical protein